MKNIHHVIHCFILFTAILLGNQKFCFSQPFVKTIKKPTSYWVILGAGSSNLGFSMNGQFNVSPKDRIFSIYAAHHEVFELFSPSDAVSELGMKYGYIKKMNISYWSLSAGISYTYVSELGNVVDSGWFGPIYDRNNRAIVGVPIELKLFLVHKHGLGTGLRLFVNLNTAKPVIGLHIGLQFGKLKCNPKSDI